MSKRSSSTPRLCTIGGCNKRVVERRSDSVFITPPTLSIAVCTAHAVAIWRQVQIDTEKTAYVEDLMALSARISDEIDTNPPIPGYKRPTRPHIPEMIYFVRLNDLIKVGWSARLSGRLRDYGPSVEVLCHYPGSRKDETELHQILTPFRAKGREWYSDSPMIRKLIAEKVAQYGVPHIQATWTEPPKSSAKLKRTA